MFSLEIKKESTCFSFLVKWKLLFVRALSTFVFKVFLFHLTGCLFLWLFILTFKTNSKGNTITKKTPSSKEKWFALSSKLLFFTLLVSERSLKALIRYASKRSTFLFPNTVMRLIPFPLLCTSYGTFVMRTLCVKTVSVRKTR